MMKLVILHVSFTVSVLCGALFTKRYMKQHSSLQANCSSSVTVRSTQECAVFCSRDKTCHSFTFHEATGSCCYSDSLEQTYFEFCPKRQINSCLLKTGYQFECMLGVCYKSEGKNLVTPNEANAFCESDGGHLVRILNKEMNDFFVNLVKVPEYKDSSRFFIDGSDTETEGVWTFSNDDVITWNNWRSGDPPTSTEINCLEFFRTSDFKWVAVPCNWTIIVGGYICEIDV